MSEPLLEALIAARRVELQLLDSLTPGQMLGERQHFVEPRIGEMRCVERQNITFEYRYADWRPDRLQALL
jgi:hypothetical protein